MHDLADLDVRISVASSATRRVVLLFDERPELPGLAFDAEFVDKFASGSADHVESFP